MPSPPLPDGHHDGTPVPDDTAAHQDDASGSAFEVVRVLDEYLEALKLGRAPSREELLAAHPEMAAQLKACLEGVEFLRSVDAAPLSAHQLGDFRLIRQVGEGGMGAVYEATQVSLGRKVALKVLRFAGVSDAEAIGRFQREAETVARLHHTNIVPIFAVGNEGGVNYYAMQFIEGQNLAEVLASRSKSTTGSQPVAKSSTGSQPVPRLNPIDDAEVARWGLQAAEALAHAHERGVVHRDVKPSNLLLDPDGRLWLTDFGLALQLGGVTLSLTGMLLGTPRYMSPEQAASTSQRIDHRSDLFSLGATLYELLTGTPAFAGETPHEVIRQLTEETPAPIRSLNPEVGRDLETIVMKCLAKDPTGRYNSAEEVGQDLRAFLEGRPIKARRPPRHEQVVRWVRQHRKSASHIGIAAAVTLAVTLLGVFGGSAYNAWNESGLFLDAVNPPLVAEFIDETGETVHVETLPMQNPVSLPSGDYQVRASGEGRLSQTFDVHLERGHRDTRYRVSLGNELLWAPEAIERSFAPVDLGTGQGLLLWTNEGASFRTYSPGDFRQNLVLSPESNPALAKFAGFTWPWPQSFVTEVSGIGNYDLRPWVLGSWIDADGDGVKDILCAGRHQAWVMALSGKMDKVIWFAGRGEDLIVKVDDGLKLLRSAVVHEPLVVKDLDGDGVADLVVTMVDIGPDAKVEQNQYTSRRWVEAISGKSGETIWSHELAKELFDLPQGVEAPYAMRWFPEIEGGRMSGGGGRLQLGRHNLRDPSQAERTGANVWIPDRPRLTTGAQPLAIVVGEHLVMLDPVTGEASEEPIPLGSRPGQQVAWGDLDGDGVDDLVWLEQVFHRFSPSTYSPKLTAWSHARRKLLWSQPLEALWPLPQAWAVEAPTWPLVVDLDGDGKCEVLVPDGQSHPNAGVGVPSLHASPWGELALLTGATGVPLWSRKLVNMDAQVDHFTVGPDVDGDGTKEVFTATLSGLAPDIYVDALSGQTGKTLWTTHRKLHSKNSDLSDFQILPLGWWQAGREGWPQLMVRLLEEHPGSPESRVLCLSAGTGKLLHAASGIHSLTPADLDGDQVEDLVVFTANSASQPDMGGKLHTVRGVGKAPWRRLGALGDPVADLDGDGVIDLVESWGDGTLVATSGATGKQLWQERAIRATSELIIRAAGPTGADRSRATPESDFDGDGIVDLVVCEQSTGARPAPLLHAISGKTGRRLWTADEVKAQITSATLSLRSCDLEGDGTSEVLWVAACDYGYPDRQSLSSSDIQLWLFVVSAESGKLKWAHPLSPQYGLALGSQPPFGFQQVDLRVVTADVNGDGTLDVLVPAATPDALLALRAVDGATGKTLWNRPRIDLGYLPQSLQNWTSPTVCDFEGDGAAEVVLIEPLAPLPPVTAEQLKIAVTLLNAADGKLRSTHPTECRLMHIQGYSHAHKGELLHPVRLRRPAGRECAAILLPAMEGESRLMFLDGEGEPTWRSLPLQSQYMPPAACDIDGNGSDELVSWELTAITLIDPDQPDKPIWSRKFGTVGYFKLLEIESRGQGKSPLLTVAIPGFDNQVFGIDAANGNTEWTCPGPIPRGDGDGVYTMPSVVSLLGAPSGQAPLVYYAYEFVGDCRQATFAVPDEKSAAGVNLAALGIVPTPAVTSPSESDTRLLRSLPWEVDEVGAMSSVMSFIVWAALYAVTLVLLPAGFLWWMVARRRFSLQTLLLLPVVAAIFLVFATMQPSIDYEFSTFATRLTIAIGATPPVIAILLLGHWTVSRRWGRVASLLTLWAGVSLLVGVVAVVTQLRQSPMLPEERFDWSSWYEVFFPGGFLASWALMILIVVTSVVKWMWRKLRPSRKSEGMAVVDDPATAAYPPNHAATTVGSASSLPG